MADSEKLSIDITADAKQAVKEIDGLTKKAEGLEKLDPEIEVQADASAAEKALGNITADAKKLDSLDPEIEVDADIRRVLTAFQDVAEEARQTAAVADRLGQALGPELAAQADPVRIVNDLKAMGLTLEQIDGDVDALGASLKELADSDVGGKLGASLGTARGKADELSDSARGANSALANMIGNTTQDLGAMGGIAGSAGVAIGQIGEYAADAAFGGEKLGAALLSMAKVAGPMAALAAASYLLGNALKSIQARKALKDDDVKAFTKSIMGGGDAVAELTKRLTDAGEILGDQKFAKGMEVFGRSDAVKDMTEDVARAGLTVGQFSQLVIDGEDSIKAWGKSMIDAGADSALIIKVGGLMLDMTKDYAEGLENAEAATKFFGKTSVKEFGKASDALEEWADRTAKGIQGMAAWDDAVKSTDWGASELDAAVDAMSEFSDAHFGLIDINADAQEAFDNFNASVKENGKTFDVSTDKGRANQKALEDVAHTLDTKLAAAYKDAGGDMETFKTKAGAISQEAIDHLMPALKNSGISAEDLAGMLGLLPEDIETRYKLSGDAEAKAKIGLLQTAIDNLPEDVQTQVTQKILVGDYQGALAIVQGYYNQHPADVKTEAQQPGNLAAIGGSIKTYYERNPVPIKTTASGPPAPTRQARGGVTPPEGGLAGEAGAEFARYPDGRTVLLTGPTLVPPRTRVTSARRTRQILQRRGVPRFANGTSTQAPVSTIAAPMTFVYQQQAPVYGVEDLDRHLAAWGQQIAQQIAVGRRS